MALASTQSANEPAKDLILVHTVQLKQMIKAHFSGRMVSSGIYIMFPSVVSSEKTCPKKLNNNHRISGFCRAAEMDF